MDFIIAFRTDLFIKVYQRILSADYTVLSMLPSANPLNAWDGFSVIGGNGYVYETFGISKHFAVKLQVLLIRAEKFDNQQIAKCFIYDVRQSSFLFFQLINHIFLDKLPSIQ